jgi:hypothetical protein
MTWRLLVVGFILVALTSVAGGQSKSAHQPIVDLPRGAVSRIPSPNGKGTPIFECPLDCSERKLWIEDRRSHTRRLVREYERSLSLSWAPDSNLFFVNDAYASNEALCYVYDPATLKSTDVAKFVASRDAAASQFLNAGHSYLKAKRWVNSHELLVVLYGHFDDPPPRGFTLRYRVNPNGGSIHKVSQRTE